MSYVLSVLKMCKVMKQICAKKETTVKCRNITVIFIILKKILRWKSDVRKQPYQIIEASSSFETVRLQKIFNFDQNISIKGIHVNHYNSNCILKKIRVVIMFQGNIQSQNKVKKQLMRSQVQQSIFWSTLDLSIHE